MVGLLRVSSLFDLGDFLLAILLFLSFLGFQLMCPNTRIRAGLLDLTSIFLILTLTAEFTFCYVQRIEYWNRNFRLRDGVYGRSFFCLTGLHFTHVFLGIVRILVTLVRVFRCHFSCGHHLFLTYRIWYWHYVDVIWILVWAIEYIWPYVVDLY